MLMVRCWTFATLLFPTLIASTQTDPCNVLCQRDGREICTGGSFTEKNGKCHRYVYRVNPSVLDYCYITWDNADSCPRNGIAVAPDNVPSLLDRGVVKVTASGHRRDVQHISGVVGDAFVGSEEAFNAYIATLGVEETPQNRPSAQELSQMTFHGSDEEFRAFINRLGSEQVGTTRITNIPVQRIPPTNAQRHIPVHRFPSSTGQQGINGGMQTRPSQETSHRVLLQAQQSRVTPIPVSQEDLVPPRSDSLANRFCGLPTDPDVASQLFSDVVHVFAHTGGLESTGPRGAIDKWKLIRGHVLLYHVSRMHKSSAFPQLVAAAILLSTNMPNVSRGQEGLFALESGLTSFCGKHSGYIRNLIFMEHRNVWHRRPNRASPSDTVRYTFARNLPVYCPNVLDSPSLRQISLLQRLYAYHQLGGKAIGALEVKVTRDRALQQSMELLLSRSTQSVAKGVSWVTFVGEKGIGKGLIRDWFTEVTKQIFNPKINLFIFDADSEAYHISEASGKIAGFENWFRAIGRFLAMSIIQQNPIGVKLPAWFFSSLLGQKVKLSDLESDDKPMFHRLNTALTGSVDDLEYCEIEIDGVVSIPTLLNRKELVDRKLGNMIPGKIRAQFNALKSGFNDFIPIPSASEIMNGPDLLYIINGEAEINVNELVDTLIFTGVKSGDVRITWTKELLTSLDEAQLRSFLRLMTGSSQVPLGGFGTLKDPMTIQFFGSPERVPTARTCFNQLTVPLYPSKEVYKQKLLIALANAGEAIMYS